MDAWGDWWLVAALLAITLGQPCGFALPMRYLNLRIQPTTNNPTLLPSNAFTRAIRLSDGGWH
jgi:hypothetical protein